MPSLQGTDPARRQEYARALLERKARDRRVIQVARPGVAGLLCGSAVSGGLLASGE